MDNCEQPFHAKGLCRRHYLSQYKRARWAANREVMRAKQRAYQEATREKQREYKRRYRDANPEKDRRQRRESEARRRKQYPDLTRRSNLRKWYGLSIEEYERLFEAQKGCCAICGRPQDEQKFRLAVDHCHETGVVRGLLCSPCNTGLGSLADSPELLRIAADYLENARRRAEA